MWRLTKREWGEMDIVVSGHGDYLCCEVDDHDDDNTAIQPHLAEGTRKEGYSKGPKVGGETRGELVQGCLHNHSHMTASSITLVLVDTLPPTCLISHILRLVFMFPK